jgi:hypothetical protein
VNHSRRRVDKVGTAPLYLCLRKAWLLVGHRVPLPLVVWPPMITTTMPFRQALVGEPPGAGLFPPGTGVGVDEESVTDGAGTAATAADAMGVGDEPASVMSEAPGIGEPPPSVMPEAPGIGDWPMPVMSEPPGIGDWPPPKVMPPEDPGIGENPPPPNGLLEPPVIGFPPPCPAPGEAPPPGVIFPEPKPLQLIIEVNNVRTTINRNRIKPPRITLGGQYAEWRSLACNKVPKHG